MSKEEQNNQLVPALRFPEFQNAGAWEEKLLNQITTSIFDGTHQTPTYTEDGIPFFSVENIVSGKLNKFISREDYLTATSKNKPEKSDVLITRIGNIGYSAIVDWDYEFSIYVTLAVVKKNDQFYSYYLHCFLQSERYQTEIRSKSLLNATPCKINMDELRKTSVLLPCLPEQQKIADCLSSLDELITVHRQKHEALKAHKKGLMQQLFPSEGETVPKLRFPKFRNAGAWEEKKICDVFDVTRGYVLSMSLVKDERTEELPYPVFSSQTKNNGLAGYYSDFLYENAITWTTDGANAGDVNYRAGKFYCTNVCGVLINTDGYANHFTAALINSVSKKHVSYVENPKLMNGVMSKIVVPFPSLEEQQKIADCLSSIDELITAQAQKIESLKAHKKGLMQQLFPATNEVTG